MIYHGLIKYCFYIFVVIPFFVISQNSNAQNKTVESEVKKTIAFGFGDQVVTKYIPRVGTQIGEGFANQSMIYTSYSGFKLLGWWNFGIPEKKITGIVYALQYNFKIPSSSSKVSFNNTVAINKYIFPTHDLDNWVADNFFNINGRIKTSIHYSHVFNAGKIGHGDRIFTIANYPVSYSIFKQKAILTPNISGAYHRNFYNKTGLAHATFGIKNQLIYKGFSLNAFVNYQHSFESIKMLTKSGFYGGLGFVFSGKIN